MNERATGWRLRLSRLGAITMLTAVAAGNLPAQRTGTFADTVLRSAVASREHYGRLVEPRVLVANRALLVDPGIESALRTSSWTATLTREQGNSEASEARVQVNLCDWVLKCGAYAADLTLAGPIDKNEPVTELADLNGLRGTARFELGASYGNKNPSGLTAAARVIESRPSFDYRTLPGLTKQSEQHDGRAYAAAAGWKQPLTGAIVVLLGQYRHEDTYKAASSADVCQPAGFGPAGTLTCDTFVVGPPTHALKDVAGAELKAGVAGGAGTDLSVSWAKATTGILARFYVVPDGSGGVGGGVGVGHRNDRPGWTFSLFAGVLKF